MSWLTEQELNRFKSVGRGVKVSTEAVIYGPENVEIGDNTRIDTGVLILASAEGAYLKLGAHIHIAARAILMASGGIEIGDFSTVGFQSVLVSASDEFSGDCLVGPVFDAEFLKVKKDPIRLKTHCIITTNCTVLPGSTMLDGSVLGACSMLKGRLSPWTLYAGIPAVHRGTRSMRAASLGEEWLKKFEEKQL